MPRGQEPLLARSADDDASLESSTQAEEEDALLSGQSPSQPSRAQRWREIGAFVWAFAATIAVVVLAVLFQHSQAANNERQNIGSDGRPSGKRNLIFMVSDGMGPSSLSLTRGYRQFVEGLPFSDTLGIDKQLIGQSRTRSSSSLVTDSAAGATAFSCGLKSYNGAISVLPDGMPCGSVMEAAKRAGYMTGLVVTTSITDATPACFASHVRTRAMEDSIAEQLVGNGPLGRNVDLILGGGLCHFQPNSTTGSCRNDDKDIVAMAEEKGWNYVDNRKDFDGLTFGSSVQLPLLGLFAKYDIPFELDRRNQDDVYPSLDEMTDLAIRALSDATRDSDQGFFLMVEGSRIDHAGHINDPAAQVHEVLAYDKAMQTVLDFLDDDHTPGLMVATSDHETGGLAVARQISATYPDYLWYPQVLANVTVSAESVARYYLQHILGSSALVEQDSLWNSGRLPSIAISSSIDEKNVREQLKELISESFSFEANDLEIDLLVKHPIYSVWILATMISMRAQIGWSTHGHSAADVNIYASSHHLARRLRGNHENIEVGQFLRWWLDVEAGVEDVTSELQDKLGKQWLSDVEQTEAPKKVDGKAAKAYDEIVEQLERAYDGRPYVEL
ncbi:hypothetical protein MBLNU457_g2671t1 [Dothideomycetes sp. NU457]